MSQTITNRIQTNESKSADVQLRYWIFSTVSPCNLDLRTSHRAIKVPDHVINTLLTQYPIQQHPPALISPRNFPLNQQESSHNHISHLLTDIYNQYTNSQLQPTATPTSTATSTSTSTAATTSTASTSSTYLQQSHKYICIVQASLTLYFIFFLQYNIVYLTTFYQHKVN